MDYMVVERRTKVELIIEVKKWLKKGYVLQGGVSISSIGKNNSHIYYAQALVKE